MNNIIKAASKFLSALAALAIGTGLPVAAVGEERELEEIVVTANKREEAVSDIAFSIQALDQQDLSNRGVLGIRELVTVVPGMSAQSDFQATGGGTSLRAVRSIVGHDSTVGYYFDDAPMTYLGYGYTPNTDIFDLERVEVLKGPQGTLYGASSMSGAIKIITKDPDASAGFGGSVGVTGYSTQGGDFSHSFGVALNLPLVEHVLAARVVYGEREVGGFIDDGGVGAPLGEDINPKENDYTRLKLKFTPNDRLTLEAMYWEAYSWDILGNTVESSSADDLEILNQGGVVTTYENEVEVITLSASYEFDSALVEYVYSTSEIGAPLDFLQGAIIATGGGWTEQDTHELRVLSNTDSPLQWIGGIYYRDAVRPFGLDLAFPLTFLDPTGIIPFSVPSTFTPLTSESYALFGEISYQFDNWTVLVGGRQFEDERTGQTRFDALENPILNPADPFGLTGFNVALLADQVPGPYMVTDADEADFSEFSSKFNVKYDFDNGNMAYLNIAKGTRSGFLNFGDLRNSVAALGLDPNDFRVITPDTVLSYELGSKGFLGESLSYEVALYFTDWEDMVQQLNSGGPNPLGMLANIGDAEIYGVEFAFTWYTGVEGLSLTARGNFMDSEVDLISFLEGTSFAEGLVYGPHGDGKVTAISHENLNVSADYVTTLGNDLDLTLNATAIYRGEQSDALAKLFRNPPHSAVPAVSEDYTLVNVSARLDSPSGWNGTLFVRNLFDEVSFSSVFDGRLLGVTLPRRIGLTLGYDF